MSERAPATETGGSIEWICISIKCAVMQMDFLDRSRLDDLQGGSTSAYNDDGRIISPQYDTTINQDKSIGWFIYKNGSFRFVWISFFLFRALLQGSVVLNHHRLFFFCAFKPTANNNTISVVLLSPSSFVSHVNLDFAPFFPQIVWCAHFYCFSFRSVAAVFLPHSHSIWLLSFVMFCANVFVTHNTIHTHKISKNRFWRVSNFIFFTATHSRIISRV